MDNGTAMPSVEVVALCDHLDTDPDRPAVFVIMVGVERGVALCDGCHSRMMGDAIKHLMLARALSPRDAETDAPAKPEKRIQQLG